MSPRGALVEADILPIPGSRIVLKRGSLEAGGRVAWAASRQAGLAFNMSVRETDWMGRRASAHQDRVDEIVTMLKAEAATNKPGQASAERPPRPVDVEAELASLHDDLTKLEDALATDVILVATHPEIQLIDIALQRVGRIMRALG